MVQVGDGGLACVVARGTPTPCEVEAELRVAGGGDTDAALLRLHQRGDGPEAQVGRGRGGEVRQARGGCARVWGGYGKGSGAAQVARCRGGG